jgi:hypothetical protein
MYDAAPLRGRGYPELMGRLSTLPIRWKKGQEVNDGVQKQRCRYPVALRPSPLRPTRKEMRLGVIEFALLKT